MLPEINHSLQTLYCYNNQLTSLPELNNSLKELNCSNNQLTVLPYLNHSLLYLYCDKNQLTVLPELNNSLQELNCSNNKLTVLPELNHSLLYLYCDKNQLPHKLIHSGNLTSERQTEINNTIRLLQKVKFTIMCLKYKQHFRDWLWIRVKEPAIKMKYHPNNLQELLKDVDENDEVAFHDTINNW